MIKHSPTTPDLTKYCLFTKCGTLTTITGPMYAGKTANLIMYVRQAYDQGLNCLVFKHAHDTRTKGTLKSRADIEEVDCIATASASNILNLTASTMPNVVFIDEVQFFPAELMEVINKLLIAHIDVVASGLDTNFRRDSFGTIITLLIARANNKISLQARCNVCNCLNAAYTQRLVNGIPAQRSDPDIVIDDGSNKVVTYEPRCRDCHIVE